MEVIFKMKVVNQIKDLNLNKYFSILYDEMN